MHKLQNRHINDVSAHAVAELLGLDYSGDRNLEHGGFFYDSQNWESYGYADAVRVSIDDGCIFIDIGTIIRPENMADALRCCRYSIDKETGNIVSDSGDIVAERGSEAFRLCEIECCEADGGIESETSRVCKLIEVWHGNGSDYFVDGDKKITLDNLQGYVVSKYLIPNIQGKN